eukprot:1754297-Prymnesium_polylepis.1
MSVEPACVRTLMSERFCIHHSCADAPSAVLPVSDAAAAVICWIAGAFTRKKRSCCHCCVLGWSAPGRQRGGVNAVCGAGCAVGCGRHLGSGEVGWGGRVRCAVGVCGTGRHRGWRRKWPSLAGRSPLPRAPRPSAGSRRRSGRGCARCASRPRACRRGPAKIGHACQNRA